MANLLPEDIGTLKGQDLLCQEYMTGVRQMPQKLFTSLHDTIAIYLKIKEILEQRRKIINPQYEI